MTFNAGRLTADSFLYARSHKISRNTQVRTEGDRAMLDLFMLSIAIASFAAAIGYALICERL